MHAAVVVQDAKSLRVLIAAANACQLMIKHVYSRRQGIVVAVRGHQSMAE
jgi:hypothetical protein